MAQPLFFSTNTLSNAEILGLLKKLNEQHEETEAVSESKPEPRPPSEEYYDDNALNDDADVPCEIRANVVVDPKEFRSFDDALKRFSGKVKKEGFLRDHMLRERGMRNDRAGRRRRGTANNTNSVDALSPLASAMVRDGKRRALRGELPYGERSDRIDMRASVRGDISESSAPAASPHEVTNALAEVPIQAVTPARPKSPDAVLIFIEFLSDPPTFGMIKDKEKPLLGFPFGGIDDPEKGVFGQSAIEAALREAHEEFFFNIPVTLSATEQNVIGTLPGPAAGMIFLVHVQVPADTPYAHGEEQTDAAIATQAEIDDFVRRRLVLPRHKAAWRTFKELVLNPRVQT